MPLMGARYSVGGEAIDPNSLRPVEVEEPGAGGGTEN
jgi:hypothetical protein